MVLRTEIERKLNRSYLHVYKAERYEEDYQLPMLRNNKIQGILKTEGCEIDGEFRYTYDISGLVPMKTLYEKCGIKKQQILNLVARILEVTETLQQYMLDPDCLILKPEYIFCRGEQYFFCYFPGGGTESVKALHELTEYFVCTLNYEDEEAVFLACELHKATLQEHCDLRQTMRECNLRGTGQGRLRQRKEPAKAGEGREIHLQRNICGKKKEGLEEENGQSSGTGQSETMTKKAGGQNAKGKEIKAEEKKREGQRDMEKGRIVRGDGIEWERSVNVFELSDEDDSYEAGKKHTSYAEYKPVHTAESVCEKGGWWKSWRKAARSTCRKRWGNWEDLIMETDVQE